MKQGMKVFGLLATSVLWGVSGTWAEGGVVRLQTAAPSCPDDSGNRYVDCENGTVTDNDTGLVWLADANCVGAVDWFTAEDFVAGLSDKPPSSAAADQDCGLSDGSSPGEWRLPSIEEWEAMVVGAVSQLCIDGAGNLGGPSITNDDGITCWQEGPASSFTGVVLNIYWSATKRTSTARGMSLNDGEVGNIRLSTSAGLTEKYLWPVRYGQ